MLLACSQPLVPATAAEPQVSLLFAGDVVLDGKPGQAIASGKDPFQDVAGLLQADISVANLECVVATGGSAVDKNFNFRAHPRTLGVLQRHFDAVGIANNHSGDYGSTAFAEMLGLLKTQGLPYFGGGHNLAEAHRPLLLERKGLRIALLAYDEFLPRSFEAQADTPGVAWSEDEQVAADIGNARKLYHADLVIPFMHWGWENEPVAGERQRRLARLMIDAGADAVIGGHPHVIQDVETYRGKPIIYSLGNFMIDVLDNPAQAKGWAVKLELSRQGVLRWESRTATIDADGIPHPLAHAQETCWDAASGTSKPCTATLPQ
jgi:poly-gamma-glutamate synthesis protein (capsule biosynthesis protein)